MKNMKTRIAAAACAAITVLCGAQALNASAFNYGHPYSGNDQEWCEMSMGRSLRMWQSYSHPEGSYWYQTVQAGTMVGKGFTTAHSSNWPVNQTLYGGIGWVRYLACSHFGFEQGKAAWLELPKTDFTSSGYYRRGDQIFLKQGNSYHAVFLTGINGDNFTVSELDGTTVKWGVAYKRLSNYRLKRVSDGAIFNIQYVARPIAEGDANGDGWVNRNDVIWIEQHNGNANYSNVNNDLLLGAADVTGNWQLDSSDSSEIYAHMYESEGYMVGNYRYVLASW
ncbi:MAG: hypothetical protein K5705_03245 [Oscillospiraceae bacterium]|nr:hypothetical protein [Oscillospiraceae bacterium]MCR4759283.1 hypothetical protein [Oscillospiraceae bacterium]